MKRIGVSLWLRVLLVGLLLFAAAVLVLSVTGNVHLVPSVLLLGAFLVPTTFAVFLYGALPRAGVSVSTLALVAIIGGLVGLALAGTFEYATLSTLGVLPLLAVGLIEEAAKLVAPAVTMQRRPISESGALLLGVSSGLGFAVFETLGYGFAELLRTDGDVGSVLQLLLMRGLLSPAGHAAWTGMLTLALWRRRQRLLSTDVMTKSPRPRSFVGTLGLVVGLHVAWNAFAAMPLYALVVLASLALLLRHLRWLGRSAAKGHQAGPPRPMLVAVSTGDEESHR